MAMTIRLVIPEVTGDVLLDALGVLQSLNELWLSKNATPETVVGLYESGVRYSRDDATEEWLPIPILYQRGVGDCEDLAAARAALLRFTGEDPDARAFAYRSRPNTWHAVVMRGDGSIEDPSARLGMYSHRGIRPEGRLILPR